MSHIVIRGRWWLLTGILGLVAISIASLRKVELDLSIYTIVESSPEALARVHEFYAETPPRMIGGVVALTWPRPVTTEDLRRVRAIGDTLIERGVVQSVFSLATVRVVPEGATLPIPRAFSETVQTSVLEAAWSHPLLRRTLISEDGTSLALHLSWHPDQLGLESSVRTEALEQALSDLVPDSVSVRFVGGDWVQRSLKKHMTLDMVRSLALAAGFFMILLPILFRTARGSVLPLIVVLSGVALFLGLVVLLGIRLTILDVAIPVLVVIIGLCDAIHLIHRFEETLSEDGDWNGAIGVMISRVGKACFYTSLTTAFGFLSLSLGEHSAVQAFGLKSALAVLVAFLTVVIFVPTLLAIWPGRRRPVRRGHGLWKVTYGRVALTTWVALGTTVFALVGVAQVRVESRLMEELPANDRAVLDLAWFERHLSGIIYLEASALGALDDPEVFRALEAFEAKIASDPDVTRYESYTLWVRELLGNPKGPLDDASIRKGVGYLRLVAQDFPRHLVTKDFKRGRHLFVIGDVGTARFEELASIVREEARGMPKAVHLETAGYSLMAHESTGIIIRSLLESFLVSLLAITIFVAAMYRSVRLGLISIVPNVLPIVFALGLSGWLGIPLRTGVMMIYCLGIGLAVDDTIHLMTRFLQERREHPGADIRTCVVRSLRHTGRALVVTSMVLGVGCLCYLPSSFQSLQDVGVLLTAVIATALVADLFLLPHLLERFSSSGRKTLEDRSLAAGPVQ